MRSAEPPFVITNTAMNELVSIAELVGKVSAETSRLSTDPVLRRNNRIRTVHSSLAIEQNTLSLDQVTAVLNGKRVLAPPKDVAEVKNAYEIYERLDRLDPCSVDDLLAAHGVMMRGLIEDAGSFRSGPVGVVDAAGNVLHFGSLPAVVPDLIFKLLDWVRTTEVHPLIAGCVFHYEFELIHPFADGNGRVGRLWHTLLLSRWNPIFAWLPVESIVHDRQDAYYAAINRSNEMGESTAFIAFMLSAIKASLMEALDMRDGVSDAPDLRRWTVIAAYLAEHDAIRNAQVRELLQVSPATANRILHQLTEEGKLTRLHEKGQWLYRLSNGAEP